MTRVYTQWPDISTYIVFFPLGEGSVPRQPCTVTRRDGESAVQAAFDELPDYFQSPVWGLWGHQTGSAFTVTTLSVGGKPDLGIASFTVESPLNLPPAALQDVIFEAIRQITGEPVTDEDVADERTTTFDIWARQLEVPDDEPTDGPTGHAS